MTRFKLPRYESSDPSKAAELHDAAIDRLVAEYAARRAPQTSPDDPDANPAPVDPPSKELPA